jgi:hypothetical protein
MTRLGNTAKFTTSAPPVGRPPETTVARNLEIIHETLGNLSNTLRRIGQDVGVDFPNDPGMPEPAVPSLLASTELLCQRVNALLTDAQNIATRLGGTL